MTIGCTGHQRLPRKIASYARGALQKDFAAATDLTGVCSLAAGADQLFARAILDAGGVLWVVVPCDNYESSFTAEEDLARYEFLLAQAARVERLDFPEPSEDAYFEAGRQVVDISDRLVALWDGREARGHGGTGDVVNYAKQQSKPVTILWLSGVERD